MAAKLLGNSQEVQQLFDLRPLVYGEDYGVGVGSGKLLSWPDLQEGEQYLVGRHLFGVPDTFYCVETIQDVNDLIGRRSDLHTKRLRIYVARRKHPINLGKIED